MKVKTQKPNYSVFFLSFAFSTQIQEAVLQLLSDPKWSLPKIYFIYKGESKSDQKIKGYNH